MTQAAQVLATFVLCLRLSTDFVKAASDSAALVHLLASSDPHRNDTVLTTLVRNFKRKGYLIAQPSTTARLPGGADESTVDAWLAASRLQRSRHVLSSYELLDASCTAFCKIVGVPSLSPPALQSSTRALCTSIGAHLRAPAKPQQPSASGPGTADWFAAYLGRRIRHNGTEDVRVLPQSNARVLRHLVGDAATLRRRRRHLARVPPALAELLAGSAFAQEANSSPSALPEQLLCLARCLAAVPRLSTAASLGIIAWINLRCGPLGAQGPLEPSAPARQLAAMLVTQSPSFDSNALAALGQQAVGLTASQISQLRAESVGEPSTLQLLGQVTGWNQGQAEALINKLISSNFTFTTAEVLRRLGTLVRGLPSHVVRDIPAEAALEMSRDEGFHRAMQKAPGYLKRAFVDKLISSASSLGDVLMRVPDHLADQVPGLRLTSPIQGPDLSGISKKHWSPEQAAVLFGAVLSATNRYSDLSASVLQGFQCSLASDLSAAEILSLVKEMQNKRVVLSSPQLSCLAKLLAAKNLTANFTGYPPDVLLFFDFASVHNHTCKAFYALASQGNLNLLPKGSTQRTQLLHGALACLGVNSSGLSPEQLGSLGALVCDMEPETITASDPGVLENLKLCPALSGAQQAALNAILLRGATGYGYPLSWDLRSLQSLGPLVLSLNQTILTSVAEEVRKAFCRSIAAEYHSQGVSQRETSVTLLKAFATASSSSRRRTKRSTKHCLSAPIVASTISDPLFLINYDTIEQFDLCLSNEVLKANLAPLLEQPLTVEYLHVMKKKIKEIYPEGIPEDQLKLFGQLSHQYTTEEISMWRVTSSDTLSALLDPTAGKWKAPEAQHLITRYLDLGGTLTGPLLQKIGGRNLCNLAEDQISKVTPEAIGSAGQLDISSCSQAKKDQLYIKAQEAFAGQVGTKAYYCLIQPYLGGAPAKDLKDLAKTGIAMDINTFTALNPEELQKLTVMDVKNLLGVNLPDLKQAENYPSVISWIKRQDQWELDHTLGIGLQGGMVKPSSTGSATPAGIIPSASIAPTTAVLTPTILPTVTTPGSINSHTTASSSTGTHKPPTPSAISLTVSNSTPLHTHMTLPSAGGSPAVTSRLTARPALTPSSTNPCSIHQSATSKKAISTTTALLATILTAVNPSATSPSSPPSSALTHNATTTSSAVINLAVTTHKTSTPTGSINSPVPGATASPAATTHNTILSTRNALSALAPNTTSAPTVTTETNIIPHKPTPIPRTSISTQKSVISSTVKTTTFICRSGAPAAFLIPSSTTTSSETTRKTPTDVPEPQNPTPVGYINLHPEAGSGSRLSFCLLHVLTAAMGISLFQGLL
ncbi:uncharacterized protein [Struthio camelus]|uniref:uncharacterized protein isoform X2 n=1 Tax=Struthio camelus TaxID=8801 RepID=UPI003603C9A1